MHRLASRPPKDFVPAALFIAQLCAYGLEKTAIAEQLNLKSQQLSSEDLLLSTRDHHVMLEWAAEQLGMPDLGMHMGLATTTTDFGLLGYLIKSASTLGDSLADIVRYHRLFAWDAHMFLRETETHLHLEYLPNKVAGVETVQDILFTLAACVAQVRLALGANWVPAASKFAFSERPLASNLAPHFGISLRFSQHVSAISISKTGAAMPMPDADPVLRGILKAQADPIIDSLGVESELIHSVRLLIAGNLHDPAFGMQQAANAVNMSVRRLHRALEQRNTTYSGLREQVIGILAREALRNSDDPVTQIAHRLGYSETSAFTRAFTRLTKQSPSKFRHASRNAETLV